MHNKVQQELDYACDMGYAEEVEQLLKNEQLDPAAYNSHALGLAAASGHVEVVRLLIQDGRIDPTAGHNAAIRYAAAHGHVEIVEILSKYIIEKEEK